MQADYSVELGREDPALELPWSSEDGVTRYSDLKRNPGLVLQIPEAVRSAELSALLTSINAAGFPLQTAKCDLWYSRELSAQEEMFNAAGKFVSYVDLVFAADEARLVFEKHEAFAKSLCCLLQRASELKAAIELVIRRCYYHPEGNPEDSSGGFCITAYVSGFGGNEPEARQRWAIAITLLQHALVQAAGCF
jgi:hypothetical protein